MTVNLGIPQCSSSHLSYVTHNTEFLTCVRHIDLPTARSVNIFNMHYFLIFSAILSLTKPMLGMTSGQLCRGTAMRAEDGNWYCSEVQAITYRNISQAGAYNRTTGVDPNTGLCAHERVSYSGTGSLTPLFGQVCGLQRILQLWR